jgi:5'-3' exonuclease
MFGLTWLYSWILSSDELKEEIEAEKAEIEAEKAELEIDDKVDDVIVELNELNSNVKDNSLRPGTESLDEVSKALIDGIKARRIKMKLKKKSKT